MQAKFEGLLGRVFAKMLRKSVVREVSYLIRSDVVILLGIVVVGRPTAKGKE